jgi:hypothetical protein
MPQHKSQSHRAASEIWKWRQTHGLMSDRSIEILAEIIERHVAAEKAHRLVKEILLASTPPSDAKWQKILGMAKELSEILDANQTKEYTPWF